MKIAGFEAVIEVFQQNGWKFQADGSGLRISTSFRTKHCNVGCTIGIEPSDDLIQVVSFFPFAVPVARRLDAGELCIRLSYRMKMGRFDLNFQTGELRFHTSSSYVKGDLKHEVIRRVLAVNLAMMEQWFLAFTATIYGNTPPPLALVTIDHSARIGGGSTRWPELRGRSHLN